MLYAYEDNIFLQGLVVVIIGMLIRYHSGSNAGLCRFLISDLVLYIVTTGVSLQLQSIYLPHEDWHFDAWVLVLTAIYLGFGEKVSNDQFHFLPYNGHFSEKKALV
jgi:hypothetical protein